MNKRRLWYAGVLLTLLLAMLPAGALAAPAVTVSPTSGPRGTAIGVSATGLNPNTDHLVQVVRGVGNVNTVRVFEDVATANERGELHYRLAMDFDPGDYTVRIVAIGGTVLATAPFTVTPGGPPGGERYFPETGYAVKGRFLGYWTAHGLDLGDPGISFRESLALFGYPLSGEFEQRLEDGRTYTVQYFERARMEFHPEHEGTPHEVLLGQFGRLIHPPDPPVTPDPSMRYFPETGHNVSNSEGFLSFWERNGGLAVFGYPLTEEFEERLEDGQVYRVQYFERARFEFHPENGPGNDVLLGHFGRLILAETDAAGPALSLDPNRGPCGIRTIARGAGFPAGLPILVQRGGDNGPVVGRGTAAGDGAFAIALDPLCDPAAPPAAGTVVTVVASPDGARGAPTGPLRVSAAFTVAAGTAPVPAITLDPDRGPCETQTRVRGAGFPAGATIAVFVRYPSPRSPGGGGAQVAQLTADGAGAFAVTVPIVGCVPDDPEGAQFTISAGVAATDGPFARAVFTVERDAARP